MAQRMCSFGATGAKRSESSCAPSAGIPRTVWPRGLAHASRDIAPLAVLLCNLLCNLCVPSVGGDISVWTPSPTRQVAQIPFKAYQGYLIVVDGRIGNLEHQNLLLDTGSNPSMIDSSVSARLGLQGTARDLSVFNKSFASESITLPDLQFSPVRRENLPVMVANFSVFSRGNLRRGARQLHLLLDTGTPQLVLFESHLRGVDYVWSGAMGSGQNVAGNVRFGTVVLSQARIGTLDVGPQRASVVASRTGIESDLDGLMGVSCLRPKRISFDFERQLLGWSD